MLLNIYLGTTAISWVTTFVLAANIKKKLDEKGYKFVDSRSFSKKMISFISSALVMSIPGWNIFDTLVDLCMGEKLYENMEDKLLKQGMIYKPTKENLNVDYNSQNLSQDQDKVRNQTSSVSKAHTQKTYDEMTTEEKLSYLQQEREKLLNQTTEKLSFLQEEKEKLLSQTLENPIKKR